MDWKKYFSTELRKFAAPLRSEMFFGESYIGGSKSNLRFLNLSTSDVRSLLKRPLSLFKLPVEQQFLIFQKIWFSAESFELKILPLYWLETLSSKELLFFSEDLISWAAEIDNWALSDSLCGHYAKIFEQAPKKLIKTYKQWNKDPNPWLRRISMVGLMYYSRSRKKFPKLSALQVFVVPHLQAEEYYVQKAVGWTIREFYNVYPAEIISFLENNLHLIHASAWPAASEKLNLRLKAKLVKKRRERRGIKRNGLLLKPKNGALDRI